MKHKKNENKTILFIMLIFIRLKAKIVI